MTQNGFTLVELLLATTIIGLILGGGAAAYSQLNKTQTLADAGKQVQLMMHSAQIQAHNGNKPAGCNHLLSYEVVIASVQSAQVKMNAECDNSPFTFNNGTVSSNYTLPTGVTVQSAFDMHFIVLAGGVRGSGQVQLLGNNHSYTFTVDPGGSISSAVLARYP